MHTYSWLFHPTFTPLKSVLTPTILQHLFYFYQNRFCSNLTYSVQNGLNSTHLNTVLPQIFRVRARRRYTSEPSLTLADCFWENLVNIIVGNLRRRV